MLTPALRWNVESGSDRAALCKNDTVRNLQTDLAQSNLVCSRVLDEGNREGSGYSYNNDGIALPMARVRPPTASRRPDKLGELVVLAATLRACKSMRASAHAQRKYVCHRSSHWCHCYARGSPAAPLARSHTIASSGKRGTKRRFFILANPKD